MTEDDPTTRPTSTSSVAGPPPLRRYEIRVDGHLGSRWTAWFDGLNLTTEDGGTTVISGPVVDQAALHGLFSKLRDLGIPLVSVERLPSGEPIDISDLCNHPIPHNPPGATS